MTLEQLVDAPADVLEKMKDEELLEIFKPYFPITRPEMVVRKQAKAAEPEVYISPQKKAALAMLAENGVDISFMKRKMKR